MKDLAEAHRVQGREDEAIKLLQRVIAIQKKTLPEEHPDLLKTQSMMAEIWISTESGKINDIEK